ncbi:ABC transporter ATP-binding protein [Proteinivorax tanatarense]|uniref:ABC transporter ATP-binding protein n=1 Tax=Proteinivorax tanatarense TaxID=1260629 RepID=A0AAU7VKN4_9FIRM
MDIIKLNNISKVYGKNNAKVGALKNISLNIKQGELISVVGKSGCGKSTLLNIIGGLDIASSGEYTFKDKKVSNLKTNELAKFRSENIGFIVQHFALINDMTVFENVALPLKYNKKSSKEIKRTVMEILEEMEILEKASSYPTQISGGQCQRVAISRALACKPSVILADEPTGAVDEQTGLQILETFKRLNKQGITVIIATHDKEIANSCNRVIEMKDGMII